METTVKRLSTDDLIEARKMFTLLANEFEEESELLSDRYLKTLLGRSEFWALAASSGTEIMGGLTAHVIPMTRAETSEVLIYDIAVLAKYQRRGIGRRLVEELLSWTSREGASEAFVLADEGDTHALDFYRKVGGKASSVRQFSLSVK
jgi:aminoglycoside 3-N-acetyltransferase I